MLLSARAAGLSSQRVPVKPERSRAWVLQCNSDRGRCLGGRAWAAAPSWCRSYWPRLGATSLGTMTSLTFPMRSHYSPDEVSEELDPIAKKTYENLLRQNINLNLINYQTILFQISDFPITHVHVPVEKPKTRKRITIKSKPNQPTTQFNNNSPNRIERAANQNLGFHPAALMEVAQL